MSGWTFKSITLKIHPERITKADRKMVNDLDFVDIKFPVSKKYYCKIEQKSSICINIYCILLLLFVVYC